MKIKTTILLLFVLFNTLCYAQTEITISGFVRDSLSLEPLVGVVVADDNMYGSVTNDYGFFSVTVTDSLANIWFSHIGYASREYSIVSSQELNVLLAPSMLSVDEVVVKGEGEKFTKVKDLGVVSVNSQQLKFIPSFMGEKDIFKYFQLLPGVNPGREGSSGMNLRGGSTDQTLILMDDIPIYNSAHAFGFVSVFSGDYIKSADLYKGYVPPQYGGRLSGVAAMNIRQGNRNEHNQSIQLGTTTISALVEGPINQGKGSYLVGGRYFTPNLFLGSASLFMSKEDSFYPLIGFYDVTAKISYDVSKKSTIYGSFYTGNDALKFVSNQKSIGDSGEDLISHTKSGLSWGNIAGSLRLSTKVSSKSFFNLTSYYSHLSNSNSSKYDDTDGNIDNFEIGSNMNELGLKANMNHNINSWYNLAYGVNFAYQHFVPQDIYSYRFNQEKSIEYGTRELYSGNLFIENKFSINDFVFNVGGRLSVYNNNNESKVVVEPRVALTYYKDQSSFWVSYVQNTQPLFSINQQMMTLPIDYWIPFQNKNELPTSSQLSAGYKHGFSSGIDVQAEVYYKKSQNISIVYNASDFLLDNGGYRLATGNAYGAEILGQYSLNRFNVMASYTYSNSSYDTDGRTIDFIYDTPHDFNLLASFQTLIKEDKIHTLSVNVNYKSGLPYFLSNEKYPMEGALDNWFEDLVNYPAYTNARLTNFFRMDLNYAMEKKLRNGSRIWQISLLNATAHRNPYIVYYNQTHQQYKAFQLISFMPSFSYTRKF